MADRITLNDKVKERRLYLNRLIAGGSIALLLILVLVARMSWLQIAQYEYYSTKSDNFRIAVQPVPPTRGLIYDRNGVLLAENKPTFSLVLVSEHVEDMEATINLLQELVELNEADIENFQSRLRRGRVPFAPVLVRNNLSEEEIARISVNQFHLPGVRVEARLLRSYPLGEAFSHAVGYMNSLTETDLQTVDSVNYSGTTQIGKMGVERFYEDMLHGQVGYETVEKNARGRIMKVLDRTDPTPGEDIVLNMDSRLQQAAWTLLGDHRGSVVALDVKTGGILAMVSKPGFDPNLFAGGISRENYAKLNNPVTTPMYNRALGAYSPGSTVKPFIGLGALAMGIRTREYAIPDPGHFSLPGSSRVYHDWTWWVNRSGHGMVNMQKAIYQSCDTYFYDLATDMGINQMHDFLSLFGFGQRTAVDIGGGSAGILPSTDWKRETMGEPWYPGETVNSSIGQGYTLATPLQLATATMVLANKGKWHQPAMLRRIGLDGEDIVRESTIADVIIDNPTDWDYIQEGMDKVVNRGNGGYRDNGTAYDYLARPKPFEHYRMAGKSGTAQVVSYSADYDDDADVACAHEEHALFISFAPVEDPEIAVAVFVEHGKGGSSVAGPIARGVIDTWLLGTMPEPGERKATCIGDY